MRQVKQKGKGTFKPPTEAEIKAFSKQGELLEDLSTEARFSREFLGTPYCEAQHNMADNEVEEVL